MSTDHPAGAAMRGASRPQGEASPRHPQLLIVDDDAAVAWALRDALEAERVCRARVVPSVAAARAAIAGGGIDAVLTDIRMPGESGLVLLEWLRERHPRLPVLVMSAYGGAAAAAPALEGVARLLAKPIDLDVLLDTVRRVLAAGVR